MFVHPHAFIDPFVYLSAYLPCSSIIMLIILLGTLI